MNKAVFLDRDGVINSDVGHYYIYKPEDVRINSGVIEGCKLLLAHQYKLFIITNQGGVAKHKYGKEDVEEVHQKILSIFKEHQITITDIYFCPHHDQIGKCLCRKPANLNIEKAIARYKIDRDYSWFIGDNVKDVEAGKASGLSTIKITANEDLLPYCEKIVSST